MEYNVEFSSTIDDNWWNKELQKSDISTIPQTTNWIKAYCVTPGAKPFFICVYNNRGDLVGQLALHMENFLRKSNVFSNFIGSKLKLAHTLMWRFGPIIHTEFDRDKIFSKIIEIVDKIAVENNVVFINGSSSPLEKQHLKLSVQNGYDVRQWGTYILNLNQNPIDYYNQLDKETRYDIRKAEKKNLEFEIVNDLEGFGEYTRLKKISKGETNNVEEIVNAQKKGKNDIHWKSLYESGFQKIFLAKYNSKPISGISDMIFNGNIFQIGVVNSLTGFNGGTFLTWNAIKWSIENGFKTYDMGGVNPNPILDKEKNIKFFKAKWKGELHHYNSFYKIMQPMKYQAAKGLLKLS